MGGFLFHLSSFCRVTVEYCFHEGRVCILQIVHAVEHESSSLQRTISSSMMLEILLKAAVLLV